MYLKSDYVYITEQYMPVELQKLLKDFKLQSRDGMIVTSSLLRGVHLKCTTCFMGWRMVMVIICYANDIQPHVECKKMHVAC